MKNHLLLLFLFIPFTNLAQIKGTITDENGNPLPFVSVFQENTYNGTTSNEQGKYELNIRKTGNYVLIFQFLGFQTKRETINIKEFPFLLNITLSEENFTLNEVIIDKKTILPLRL